MSQGTGKSINNYFILFLKRQEGISIIGHTFLSRGIIERSDNMTTRTYYLPQNRFSLHLINYMISKVGCSIGDIKVNRASETIRVPITCNDKDVQKIERILFRYDLISTD